MKKFITLVVVLFALVGCAVELGPVFPDSSSNSSSDS